MIVTRAIPGLTTIDATKFTLLTHTEVGFYHHRIDSYCNDEEKIRNKQKQFSCQNLHETRILIRLYFVHGIFRPQTEVMASLLSEVYKKMPYLHHGGKFCQLTHTNVNKRKKEKWQHRRLKLRETKYNINYVVNRSMFHFIR
uniref:Uncharacterized protein n=1 Tax=Cacopsylla melanoneura TaxID=428564 RepID=A0A8D8RP01_9HEMI